jgi:hypothetical protein
VKSAGTHRLAACRLEVVERQLQLIVLYVFSIRIERGSLVRRHIKERDGTFEALARSAP